MEEENHIKPGEDGFYVAISMIAFCTLMAGLMSGLTVGLASIDRLSLEIEAMEDKEKKKMADRILPVIDKHHWMLVTLLLCNAACMEAMPIFLAELVSEVIAIILSVTLVLLFGEIIP